MLTIDIGNSRIKWAVFVGDAIERHGVLEYDIENLQTVLKNAGLPQASDMLAISCVADKELKECFIDWLNSNGYTNYRFVETRAEQCGIVNSYELPENMGVDRWLAMLAAFRLCDVKTGEIVCVIDCGTAITLDALNAKGNHLGGLIMPGYQTMIKSLIAGTGNIESFGPVSGAFVEPGLAVSTSESISKGCSQLIISGLSAIVENYQSVSELKVHCIVTGGDGEWVSGALACKNSYNPFLVLQGLNYVSTNTK